MLLIRLVKLVRTGGRFFYFGPLSILSFCIGLGILLSLATTQATPCFRLDTDFQVGKIPKTAFDIDGVNRDLRSARAISKGIQTGKMEFMVVGLAHILGRYPTDNDAELLWELIVHTLGSNYGALRLEVPMTKETIASDFASEYLIKHSKLLFLRNRDQYPAHKVSLLAYAVAHGFARKQLLFDTDTHGRIVFPNHEWQRYFWEYREWLRTKFDQERFYSRRFHPIEIPSVLTPEQKRLLPTLNVSSVISVDALRHKINSLLKEKGVDSDLFTDDIYGGVEELRTLTKSVKQDLKAVIFNTENISAGDVFSAPVSGYEVTKQKVPYLAVTAGGDSETPLVFIIYWDGQRLRGYVPKNGNPWNTMTKRAYGNSEHEHEHEHGDRSDIQDAIVRFPWIGFQKGDDQLLHDIRIDLFNENLIRAELNDVLVLRHDKSTNPRP